MIDKANTPDEIVDIVDENDNVIGKSTKGEVNSNPKLIHREIAVLIFDEQNRVLLQQRSRSKKNDPLVWIISVAGHVPSGMTYEEAAHMELKEELGFDTKLIPYEKAKYQNESETQLITSFLGEFPKEAKVNFNKDEIENCKFLDSNELEELNNTEKIEPDSLNDFREFFKGNYDKYKQMLIKKNR